MSDFFRKLDQVESLKRKQEEITNLKKIEVFESLCRTVQKITLLLKPYEEGLIQRGYRTILRDRAGYFSLEIEKDEIKIDISLARFSGINNPQTVGVRVNGDLEKMYYGTLDDSFNVLEFKRFIEETIINNIIK